MTLRVIWVLFFQLLATGAGSSEFPTMRIASSSTVYPFLAAAAEHLGAHGKFRAPIIESLGSGGAFKLLCAKVGLAGPALVGSSRRIDPIERQRCTENGSGNIYEIVIGYDGVVVANGQGGPLFHLTRQQLFLAMARSVPVEGKVVPNPYARWDQIDPALPHQEIRIYGPAPNHGTRDVLSAKVMQFSCNIFPEYLALPAEEREKQCSALREDGRVIEVSQDYNVTLQRLGGDRFAIGILPFSLLAQNRDRLQAAELEDSLPSKDNIYSGDYVLSRSLYVYVNQDQISDTQGLWEFLVELTSDKAMGFGGYLADQGLIPLSEPNQRFQAARVQELHEAPQ